VVNNKHAAKSGTKRYC